MHLLPKFFPELNSAQHEQLKVFEQLLIQWNKKLNLVSRKDEKHIVEHHILHSLAIAKVARFKTNYTILDIGTGGGLPGIPLAIYFPECTFYLVDSIQKKVAAVENMVQHLSLKNTITICSRVEQLDLKVDALVSRAVAPVEKLVKWTKKLQFTNAPEHMYLLKGGSLEQELSGFRYNEYIIHTFYPLDFFLEKKIIEVLI